MCNVAISFNGVFNNVTRFLNPGYKIGLHQISFEKKNEENVLVVNVYCNCIHKDSANPFGILRSMICQDKKNKYNYVFHEDLIFLEINSFQNTINLTLDKGFEINSCTLIILNDK